MEGENGEEKEKMIRTTIGGKVVYYTSDARQAVEHLRKDLEPDQAKVYFRDARRPGGGAGSSFEDDEERDFDLTFDRSRNVYELRRKN